MNISEPCSTSEVGGLYIDRIEIGRRLPYDWERDGKAEREKRR
jgi:hypothetical protein